MSEVGIAVLEIFKDSSDTGLGACDTDRCIKKRHLSHAVVITIGLMYILDIAMDTAAVSDITDVPQEVSIPINESLASNLTTCTSSSSNNVTTVYYYKCYNKTVVARSLENVRTAYYVFLAISWALFVAEMVTFVLFGLVPICTDKTVVKEARALSTGKVLALCVVLLEDLPLSALKFWYAFGEGKYESLILIQVSAFVAFLTGTCKFIFSMIALCQFPARYQEATGESLGTFIGCSMCIQWFAEVWVAALSLGAFINFFGVTVSTCDCSDMPALF